MRGLILRTTWAARACFVSRAVACRCQTLAGVVFWLFLGALVDSSLGADASPPVAPAVTNQSGPAVQTNPPAAGVLPNKVGPVAVPKTPAVAATTNKPVAAAGTNAPPPAPVAPKVVAPPPAAPTNVPAPSPAPKPAAPAVAPVQAPPAVAAAPPPVAAANKPIPPAVTNAPAAGVLSNQAGPVAVAKTPAVAATTSKPVAAAGTNAPPPAPVAPKVVAPPPVAPTNVPAPSPAPKPAAPAVAPVQAPPAVAAAPPPVAATNKPVPAAATNTPADRGYTYVHDQVARMPWSIHVVKVSRKRGDLVLDTVLGGGATLGMGVVSEMVNTLPPAAGKPVAAVNGDFFNYSRNYPGDPQGLQISRGELVSAPYSERVCFWVDAQGEMHRTNVTANFQVIWADGTSTPFGLNQDREIDEMVLYTGAIGSSTRTYGGRELILMASTNTPLTPLRVGSTCAARVKTISDAGNSPLTQDTLVLSIGPRLVARLPKVAVGATLQLSTATTPSLSGARTGLGGGPSLLRAGKPAQWRGWIQLRHPRTAIGWNKDFFFMVEVDGRQNDSIGMTFPELADYMLKLGCQEALNLDGGGSATIWADGQVKNSPSPGQERPAANALVLFQKSVP